MGVTLVKEEGVEQQQRRKSVGFLLSGSVRSVTGDSGHHKPSVSELGPGPDARV